MLVEIVPRACWSTLVDKRDVVPIYEVKQEPTITDFVETSENPFDNNPGGMETFGRTPSESVGAGLKKHKNKRRIHKDPEVHSFLDQGAEITEYY